jgi:hypothetical protein
MTLTETVIMVKKMTPVVVIGGLVILIMIFGFQLTLLIVRQQISGNISPIQPTAAPIPEQEMSFGKLPVLKIPGGRESVGYAWVLDTLDGTARFEGERSEAKVYFIPKQIKSLTFESRIFNMAKQVGINTEQTPYEEVEDVATFDDGKRKIEVNTLDFNFRYDYLITAEDNLIDDIDIGLESAFLSSSANFLNKLNRYPVAISSAKTNFSYFRIDPATRQIEPLESAARANAVEVNYFPVDFDELPIVTSTYYESQNYIFLLKTERDYSPIRASIQNFPINIDNSGRYRLKTSTQAWEDLQQGKGIIVSSPQESGEVRISRIFLAYYEPSEYQQYFQPVYVFLGENRFVVYVQAVSSDLIQ